MRNHHQLHRVRTIESVLELETDGDDKEGVGVVFGRPRMKERRKEFLENAISEK